MVMISIVMPVYNKKPYIARAIESVLAQSYTDFELLVVDDGSTDGGDHVVESLSDPRIRLIRQKNAGVAAARNTGIRNARGEWIAFLDADDRWYEHNLSSHWMLLQQHPDVMWSAGLYNYIYSNGESRDKVLPPDVSGNIRNGLVDNVLTFLQGYYFHTNTIVIKKSVFEDVGLFEVSLKTAEDLDMWIRIALKHPKICYCNKVIATYYKEIPSSLTTVTGRGFDNQHLPIIAFARKYLAILPAIERTKSEPLLRLCCQLIQNAIDMLIVMEAKGQACKVLNEFRKYLPGKYTVKSIIKLLMPVLLYRCHLNIRKKCRL